MAHGYVLQIPEFSAWNEYVNHADLNLRSFGYEPLHAGVCRDDFVGVVELPPLLAPRPDIVHLHWPDTLTYAHGPHAALAFLRGLYARGVRIVQTVHNLWPHDAGADLRSYFHAVDELTAGVHFFSEEHERLARAARPRLPPLSLHMPHPRYPDLPEATGSTLTGPFTIGCFGRLRPSRSSAERHSIWSLRRARHAGTSMSPCPWSQAGPKHAGCASSSGRMYTA